MDGVHNLLEVIATETMPSQRQKGPQRALQSRQEEGAPHIRKESNGSLRHGKDGILCGHPEWPMHRDAISPSH